MLRELIHLARHAPKTLALKRRLSHVDLYDTVMQDADDAVSKQDADEKAGNLSARIAAVQAAQANVSRLQALESFNNGFWSARSFDFYRQPVIHELLWLRMIPDTIFILGGVVPVVAVTAGGRRCPRHPASPPRLGRVVGQRPGDDPHR